MDKFEEIKKNRNEYQKEYRKRHDKNHCACGGKYTIDHKNVHLKTKKHQKFVMLLDPETKKHYDNFFKF